MATSTTAFPKVLVVNLANNRLSGPLPNTIVGLTSLISLQLQGNQFTGEAGGLLAQCVQCAGHGVWAASMGSA